MSARYFIFQREHIEVSKLKTLLYPNNILFVSGKCFKKNYSVIFEAVSSQGKGYLCCTRKVILTSPQKVLTNVCAHNLLQNLCNDVLKYLLPKKLNLPVRQKLIHLFVILKTCMRSLLFIQLTCPYLHTVLIFSVKTFVLIFFVIGLLTQILSCRCLSFNLIFVSFFQFYCFHHYSFVSMFFNFIFLIHLQEQTCPVYTTLKGVCACITTHTCNSSIIHYILVMCMLQLNLFSRSICFKVGQFELNLVH